jgi:hypothetical protein
MANIDELNFKINDYLNRRRNSEENLRLILSTFRSQRIFKFSRKSINRTKKLLKVPREKDVIDNFSNHTIKAASKIVYYLLGTKLKTVRRKMEKNKKFVLKCQKKLRKQIRKISYRNVPDSDVQDGYFEECKLLLYGAKSLFIHLIDRVRSFWLTLNVYFIILTVR